MSCSSPMSDPARRARRRGCRYRNGRRDLRPGLLAQLGGGLGLERERRRAIELVGDQAEEDLADPRRGERRAEFLVDRAVGLGDPLGDDPLARDQSGQGLRLALRADRQHAARFLVRRQGAGAEDAVAEQRPEGRGDLRVQRRRAGRRVGGRLDLGEDLRPELPGRPDVFAEVFESAPPWRSSPSGRRADRPARGSAPDR